jgi:hypothetical protein
LTIRTSPLLVSPAGSKLIVKSAPSLSVPRSVSPARWTWIFFFANSPAIQSAALAGAAGEVKPRRTVALSAPPLSLALTSMLAILLPG